ncbi:MAG: single-stranded DNA endonuclease, partial [Tissierellaceae bacterium]
LARGYASVFLRSSLAPSVIGMDIIDSQREHIQEMARLVFTLTPENSRGVPLWLDIVDKEVLISDDIMRSMMEEYLDRDLYERFFVSERDKRS